MAYFLVKEALVNTPRRTLNAIAPNDLLVCHDVASLRKDYCLNPLRVIDLQQCADVVQTSPVRHPVVQSGSSPRLNFSGAPDTHATLGSLGSL